MTFEERKQWIDALAREFDNMLYRWRYAPAGDPMTHGEAGKYFRSIYDRRKEEIGPEEFTAASKRVDARYDARYEDTAWKPKSQ